MLLRDLVHDAFIPWFSTILARTHAFICIEVIQLILFFLMSDANRLTHLKGKTLACIACHVKLSVTSRKECH